MSNYIATDTDLTAVANAIRTKGGTSAALVFPGGFVDAIGAITTGPASVTPSDVNFIDCDGTLLYSYTAQEFADLTALPADPSIAGLTAQGWNYTLEDAKAYVAANGKLIIGQTYATSDGKTRLYVSIQNGRLSPYVGFAVNGTAVIDWGDDSDASTVTGSSTSTVQSTNHTYSAPGDYVISIAVTGSLAIVGDSTIGSKLVWKNNTSVSENNRIYQGCLKYVEIGENVSVGNYAFMNCFSLLGVRVPNTLQSIGTHVFYNCTQIQGFVFPHGITSIPADTFIGSSRISYVSIPKSVTSIDNEAFLGCCSVNLITAPSGLTSIGNDVFKNCYSLAEAILGDSVASIAQYTFYNCFALRKVTIPASATSIGTYAFYNCQTLTEITIPELVTTISAYAFNACKGLGVLRFTRSTPPTVSSSNAFSGLQSDCEVHVPNGKLSAYTSATNYPASANVIYVEDAA